MTVDWDGKIRMDPSSPYAMARMVALEGPLRRRVRLRHRRRPPRHRHAAASGLLNPNHYLSVAIAYLFANRPGWPATAAVGKTVVSSSMIDRVAAKLGRTLVEVPVGFKWFVDGLLDGGFGFAGEESAGASFLRRDGTVWTTDKDGIIPGLLAAEITARTGRDPGEHWQRTDRASSASRPTSASTRRPPPEQKAALARLTPADVRARELAGEPIRHVLANAPGNGAPIGGVKVVAEHGWFAARPSGHRGRLQDLRRELPRTRPPAAHPGRRPRDPAGRAGVRRGGALSGSSSTDPPDHDRTDRRPRPERGHPRRRAARGAGARSALDLEPFRRRAVGAPRSGALGAHAQPVGRAADRGAHAPAGSAARAHVPPAARIAGRGTPDLPHLPRLVPAASPGRAARLRRLLQHGVRAQRGAPHLLGRARERRRRPAEGRARPRRAGGGDRAALSAGLLPAGHRARRLAARALSAELALVPAGHAGARSRRRVAAPGGGRPGPQGLPARVAGAGRPHDALPARRQRSRQQSRRPRDHQRAVRRWAGTASDAGDHPRDRRLVPAAAARSAARRVPPQRGARGVRGARAGARLHGGYRPAVRRRARRDTRGEPVHDAHAGGRGIRPVRRRGDRAHAGRVRAQGARHLRRSAAGARPRAAVGSLRALQHGVPRHPRQPGRQRRQPAARVGEPLPLPVALPALADHRGADRPCHQRRPRPHLGLGGRRRAVDARVRKGSLDRHTGGARGAGAHRGGRRAVGAAQRRPPAPAGRGPRAAREPARRGRRARARDRRRQDGLLCRRADPGLRPPLRHLQAAEPAAARPRSPAPPADERRATGAARRRRQGAPGRSSPGRRW